MNFSDTIVLPDGKTNERPEVLKTSLDLAANRYYSSLNSNLPHAYAISSKENAQLLLEANGLRLGDNVIEPRTEDVTTVSYGGLQEAIRTPHEVLGITYPNVDYTQLTAQMPDGPCWQIAISAGGSTIDYSVSLSPRALLMKLCCSITKRTLAPGRQTPSHGDSLTCSSISRQPVGRKVTQC